MNPDKKRALFVISAAAELAGMHPQTLRIYERRGLIDPQRTPGGTRRYSEEDIERLALIAKLTEEGLNLEGVRRVIALEEEVASLRRRLAELESEMERRVGEVHRSYRYEIVLRSQVLPAVRR